MKDAFHHSMPVISTHRSFSEQNCDIELTFYPTNSNSSSWLSFPNFMISYCIVSLVKRWWWNALICYHWVIITEYITCDIDGYPKRTQLISQCFNQFSQYTQSNIFWSKAWTLHRVLPLTIPYHWRVIDINNTPSMWSTVFHIPIVICINISSDIDRIS